MISSQQLGERITEVRKNAGLTQAEMANKIGVSRTTLVSIEKGERRPSNSELLSIAQAARVGVHDLLREHRVSADVSPRFRMMQGTEAKGSLEAVNRLRAFGQRYAELERMHGLERVSPLLETIQTYRAEQGARAQSVRTASVLGREAAHTVRGLLGFGDGPASSLDERFELEAGLRIFYFDKMPRGLAAFLLWGDDIGACVAVNQEHSSERQRWSLTHELGHFLRDRESGDVLVDAPPSKDPSEVFAESFTASFLMPGEGIARQFSDRCRVNGDKFTAVDISTLAQSYEVSFQAMTLRLEELGLLPRGTLDRLHASKIRPRPDGSEKHGVKGARRPVRSRFPKRYVELTVSAYEQAWISEGELADFFEADRVSARAIYQENAQLFVDEDRTLPMSSAIEDLRA